MASAQVLDTNVIIRHATGFGVAHGLLSAVVLQELTAGAADGGMVRHYQRLRVIAQAEGRLLVPDGEDWWYAGKVLNALLRGVRSSRGHTPAIGRGEQQRLLRDVLIARTARRVNAAVVTYNGGDFRKIRRFCAVRVVAPDDVF